MSQGKASEKKGSRDADLLAALQAPPKRRKPGFVCGMTRILKQVTPEVADQIQRIIDDIREAREVGRETRYTSVWLADLLSKQGYHVTSLTVGRHVARRCACE